MIVTHDLERPPVAELRGGDCRARDLRLGRNVWGRHRFATTSDCRIANGLVAATVGAVGTVPTLTLTARRGAVVTDDVYTSLYHSLYGGSYTSPATLGFGVVTLDSPDVAAVLASVHILRPDPDHRAITLRMSVPLVGDLFVTLRQGEPFVRIQHGRTRGALVTIARRISLAGPPTLVGTAYSGRVQESEPALTGMPRWIGSKRPATADAGAFSLTSSSATWAYFGVGVASSHVLDTPADMLGQMADASQLDLLIDEDA